MRLVRLLLTRYWLRFARWRLGRRPNNEARRFALAGFLHATVMAVEKGRVK